MTSTGFSKSRFYSTNRDPLSTFRRRPTLDHDIGPFFFGGQGYPLLDGQLNNSTVIDLEEGSGKRPVSNLRVDRKEDGIQDRLSQVVKVNPLPTQGREVEDEFHYETCADDRPVSDSRGSFLRLRDDR